MKSKEELIQLFKQSIAEETGMSLVEVDADTEFVNLGLDSVNAIFALEVIEKELNIMLNPILFWEYPTINKFIDHLYKQIENNH